MEKEIIPSELTYEDFRGILKKKFDSETTEEPLINSVCVYCEHKETESYYIGFDSKTKQILFKKENISGIEKDSIDFLAIIHAIKYCNDNEMFIRSIYTDNKTALDNIWEKSIGKPVYLTKNNQVFVSDITKGEKWLQGFKYANRITLWDAERWGDIKSFQDGKK